MFLLSRNLVLVISLVLAVPADGSAAFQGPAGEVHRLHNLGVEGDKRAVLDCIALAESILESDPGNQLVRVFLGSALTLRSRDLFLGPSKLKLLREGGAVMDAAVEAAPDDPSVRLVRAINSSQLPKVFGRHALAVSDFFWLLAHVAETPATFSTAEKYVIYSYAADTFRNAGEEKAAAAADRAAMTASTAANLAKQGGYVSPQGHPE